MLQGPVGPFFRRLQDHLESEGYDTWRISFNAGDRFFSRKAKRIDFVGSASDWEGWFSAFIDNTDIDHVVLFGSGRPAHRIARRIAQDAGINVVSLEEGYVRPGFISAEFGGNNADSPLAGHLPPEGFKVDKPKTSKDYKAFKKTVFYGAVYYTFRSLLSFGRERLLFHRRFTFAREPILWIRNFWRRLVGQSQNYVTIERLLEHHDKRYFLVPLQVAADSQMGPAALGWSAPRLIAETLRSFANSKQRDHYRLVFKIHPMERGHSDDRRLVMQTAEALGIADRVDVVDVGSLGLLTRHSAGMITINSTSGLSAIGHGVPLMVIGSALYSHPELATCANGNPDFDAFWAGGPVAPKALRLNYQAWLRENALVPGDFYAAEGMDVACKGIIEKIRSAG